MQQYDQCRCIIFGTMKIMTGILLLLYGFTASAQNASITGTVTDAQSKRKIAGANIFISNTSKGTVSNADGYFALYDIPAGKYELVISITGYETVVFPFNSNDLPKKLDVQMEIKVKQWETVNVTPFEKNGWEKWGRLFSEAFLGQSPNAADCKILNKEAIRFRYNKKEGYLEAVADTLLLIENKALGYIIRYQLETFEYNFSNRSVIYGGYPLFVAMDTSRRAKQRRYAKARQHAFYGSPMHFMRSLYNNRLAEEGFEVRRSKRVPNTEKERVKKKLQSVTQTTGGMRITFDAGRFGDSSEYFRQVMRQPDNYELVEQPLLTADSLLHNGLSDDYKLLGFTGQLLVIFKNEEPVAEYQRSLFGRMPPQQTTRLFFTAGAQNELYVYANGSYFDPLTLFLDGYMGWEKLAELLPLEYDPGN